MDNEELMRDIVTLVDEEGNEHEFEIIDSLVHNETEYLALQPTFDTPEESLDDSGELVLLKVVDDTDEENFIMEAIEDDEEFETISKMFMERLEEIYDFDGEEE